MIDYTQYTELLNTHVDQSGMINYATLQKNREPLDTFLKTLTNIPQETYNGWTQNDQLAFWINAYNAITLREIVDHYPIQKGSLINRSLYPENSIRQINGVWGKNTTHLLGQDITLHQIENAIIRSQFNEPRIHFAIVCASLGCPPLRNEAFIGPKLEAQLSDQTRKFLADPAKFTINSKKKKIQLSPIFDWFESDFNETSIRDFIAQYAPEGSVAYINDPKFKIKHLDYDWSLNEQQ